MPLVDVELRPVLTSLTELHALCNLKERVSDTSIRYGTLSNLLVGWVSQDTSSNGDRGVVASIKPLAGPPLVSPPEVKRSVFKIGRVTVHRVPQGAGVGFSTGRGKHDSRRSGCEKKRSGLMGIPTS